MSVQVEAPTPGLRQESKRSEVPYPSAAQGFPGHAAEEGVALDVTHAPASRSQPVARIKLEELWDNKTLQRSSLGPSLDACEYLNRLTSVSRDAAAVLRWWGMRSWVCEWIPAGWSCHRGCRHSEKYDPMLTGGLNMNVENPHTIPVRSSNNKAPRLHQSHASVILDTPPISVDTQ